MRGVCIVLCCLISVVLSKPLLPKDTPDLPDVYTAYLTVSLPYADIVEPISYWYDAENQLQRVDYYGGMDSYITQGNDINMTYQISPMQGQEGCLYIPGPVELTSIFPDLSIFDYVGEDSCGVDMAQTCDVWQFVDQEENKTNTYTFYWDSDNEVPVRYHLMGYDSLFGSHFDEYVVDYGMIDDSPIDPEEFNPPLSLSCTLFPGAGGPSVSAEWEAMNPFHEIAKLHPHAEDHLEGLFSGFMNTHGKTYQSDEHREYRKQVFGQNLRYVNTMNRQKLSYKMAINNRGDWNDADFTANMNTQRYPASGNHAGSYHVPKMPRASLPDSIDWRQLGAVTAVKDQGICGSCWSFGAHETIEGSNFVQTGELLRLSSQSLVDCSWAEGNTGCSGGLDFQAYDWILSENEGFIPTESSYPYLMANGICHADRAVDGVAISGYVNVTSFDQYSLQDALVSMGPVSVSIDASHKSFSFYSEGTYFEPDCGNGPDDLDHTVLAVGYGTDEMGIDYWIVKNSWSTYWGDEGFVYMSATDNNCGVETVPTYTLIDTARTRRS